MPIATRMFLFSKDTRRFLARLENQTHGKPSEWKRLAAWINKKRWEYCLGTPVMPPTPVASISQRKNVAFILKIRKKYKLQTGATGGDEYFSLKLITTWSCSPGYLQLSAWFFSHNFSSKAHGSLWCVTEQEFLHAAAFPGKQFN